MQQGPGWEEGKEKDAVQLTTDGTEDYGFGSNGFGGQQRDDRLARVDDPEVDDRGHPDTVAFESNEAAVDCDDTTEVDARLSFDVEGSIAKARHIIRIEEFLHIFHEQAIQSAVLGWHWFVVFWNVYYGSFHFVVTAGALIASPAVRASSLFVSSSSGKNSQANEPDRKSVV